MKNLLTLVACAAVYGFSVGCAHSLTFAFHNLIKFPLLLVITASVCAVAYHLVASFAGAQLRFAEVQALTFALFRDASVMLASLAPVGLFLSLTHARPTESGLHEYPLFLGFNVVLIAVAGITALWRQARGVREQAQLSRKRGAAVVGGWLVLSLLVGSQAAWFLRPFFGVATIRAEDTPFFLGARPDFRGATNFYEAIWDLFHRHELSRSFDGSDLRSTLRASFERTILIASPGPRRDAGSSHAPPSSLRLRVAALVVFAGLGAEGGGGNAAAPSAHQGRRPSASSRRSLG